MSVNAPLNLANVCPIFASTIDSVYNESTGEEVKNFKLIVSLLKDAPVFAIAKKQ